MKDYWMEELIIDLALAMKKHGTVFFIDHDEEKITINYEKRREGEGTCESSEKCRECKYYDPVYFKDNENGQYYEYRTETIFNCLKKNKFIITEKWRI